MSRWCHVVVIIFLYFSLTQASNTSIPYTSTPGVEYPIESHLLNDSTLVVARNATLAANHARSTAFHTRLSHIGYPQHVEQLYHQSLVFWNTLHVELQKIFPDTHASLEIVDLGGASGSLAALIAQAWPNARVTVVDIDHTLLSLGARKYADLVRSGRIKFVHADVSQPLTMIPSGSLDLVVSQYVFQHLYTPRTAVESILTLLKSHGWLFVVDADVALGDTVYPDPPTIDLITGMNELRRDVHPAGLVSGRLINWFIQLLEGYGFENVAMQPHFSSSRNLDASHFLSLLSPMQYFPLVRYGRLSYTDFNDQITKFNEYIQKYVDATPRAFVMTCAAVFWNAQKPATDSEELITKGRRASQSIPALVEFETRIQDYLSSTATDKVASQTDRRKMEEEHGLEEDKDTELHLDDDADEDDILEHTIRMEYTQKYPSPARQIEFEAQRARMLQKVDVSSNNSERRDEL